MLAKLVEHLMASGGLLAGGRADLDADAGLGRFPAEGVLRPLRNTSNCWETLLATVALMARLVSVVKGGDWIRLCRLPCGREYNIPAKSAWL